VRSGELHGWPRLAGSAGASRPRPANLANPAPARYPGS
jgi:hypothetical protein